MAGFLAGEWWIRLGIGAAVFAAMSGLGVALSLVILMLAPAATVVGYEIHGHRDVTRALGNSATRT